MEIYPGDKEYSRLLGIQKDAATSILSLALRADEARFRAQSETGIQELLARVRALQAQPALPSYVIEATEDNAGELEFKEFHRVQ